MRNFLIAGAALTLLAACDSKPDDLAVFDGAYYRASVKSERGAREVFNVVVRDAEQGLNGAREAGRFEAIKHCIRETASSEIEWTVGPDSPDSSLVIRDGQVILSGRCVDPR